MRVPIVISMVSLGTGTTATQMSGDRSGNATDFIVPTWCRALTRMRTYISEDIPTVAQTVSSTCRITSSDLNVGNFEVLCEPLGSVLGATVTQFNGNGQNAAEYPWNMGGTRKLQGGEHFQFFGQAQVANTADPTQGAMVWADSDGPDMSIPGQWYSIAMSIFNSSSNPGETGTGTGIQTGNVFTVSGQGKIVIRALYGAIYPTTIVAGDMPSGFFQIQAPEIAVPLQWNVEPQNGFLSTIGQAVVVLSQCEGIAVEAATPTSITPTLNIFQALGTDGDWEVAMMYQ